MKRSGLAVACLVLAVPVFAEKPDPYGLAPTANVTIAGSPLTIDIGDDTRMQVHNTNVPGGTGQFYPPGSLLGNSGVWISLVPSGGVLYGPFLGTAYTPVSLSPVTGTGTAIDPFTVVIVENAGTALVLTETLTYVNGSQTLGISLNIAAGQTPPTGGYSVFIGADLYLAANDAGFPYAVPGAAAGSHAADSTCTQQLQYTIAFLGTTPAQAYTADGYSAVFSQIAASALTNNIAPGCLDDGAALQWNVATAGAPTTINTGVSFTGQAVPVGAAVPALSTKGLAALVLLLAAVGYVLARKSSFGA